MSGLHFPPLFHGMLTAGDPPMDVACAAAREGCDAGLVAYDLRPDVLRAAIVFAPEVSLREAVVMLPICGVGFQNAFGALAPPEVSVHLEWDGTIRINGGICGKLEMTASSDAPAEEPDWLVVGLSLTLWADGEESGLTPDVTALNAEGCGDMEAPALLEAWVRHTLVWINRWLEDGSCAVHGEWKPLAHGLDAPVSIAGREGIFAGVDENFGMILKQDNTTAIIPLTDILRKAP